jgi:predicted HAD superfamily phosphohydrolase YqeG
VRCTYDDVTDERSALRRVGQLSVKTVVFDVEPLVAYWDSSQEELDRGIGRVVDQVRTLPGVRAVCFATNSARLPSTMPEIPDLQVMYLVSARKPLCTAPYLRLPRPGTVVGDQVATDGLLARRLGYTFLHYRPGLSGAPLGPKLLSGCGTVMRPLLFERC